MKKFLFPVFMALFMACTATGDAQSKVVKPDAFESVLKSDKSVQLIDVRTPEEYKAGHLEGAKNIDFYSKDFAQQMAKLDKNKPVAVYCAVGGRSASATDKLKSLGFAKIYDLDGGIRGWTASGKKTVQ